MKRAFFAIVFALFAAPALAQTTIYISPVPTATVGGVLQCTAVSGSVCTAWAFTTAGSGTITGSGTSGAIAKFTAAGAIGNSIITESGATGSVSGTWSVTQLILRGSTSGTLNVKCPAACGATTVTLPAGTTDFSATGAGYVYQASAGAAFTVTPVITATTGTFSSTLGVTGVATFTAQPIMSSLTASSAVATDGSKGLVSVANTGTGNNVLSASPTFTGTITAATISATGNISTTSGGSASFQIAPATGTNAGIFRVTNTGNNSYLGAEASVGGSTLSGSTAYALMIGTASNVPIEFFTNNAKTMSIAATTGIVNVTATNGGSTTDSLLTVTGVTGTNYHAVKVGNLWIWGRTSSSEAYISSNNNGWTNTITAASSTFSQNAGVFTWLTGASQTAGTATNVSPVMALSLAGVLTINNLATGSLTSASGVITSSSDERLKDIVGPLGYGLAEVLALRPIRYHWNKTSGIPTEPEYGGFGAAQVESVMPLAVSYGGDGYRALNDRVILAAYANAIQEQETRLRAVEDKIGIQRSPKTVMPAGAIAAEIAARKAAEQKVIRSRCDANNAEMKKQGKPELACKAA